MGPAPRQRRGYLLNGTGPVEAEGEEGEGPRRAERGLQGSLSAAGAGAISAPVPAGPHPEKPWPPIQG